MDKHCIMCDDCEHYSYDKGHCSLGFIHINEERTDCMDFSAKRACRTCASHTRVAEDLSAKGYGCKKKLIDFRKKGGEHCPEYSESSMSAHLRRCREIEQHALAEVQYNTERFTSAVSPAIEEFCFSMHGSTTLAHELRDNLTELVVKIIVSLKDDGII